MRKPFMASPTRLLDGGAYDVYAQHFSREIVRVQAKIERHERKLAKLRTTLNEIQPLLGELAQLKLAPGAAPAPTSPTMTVVGDTED